MLTIKPELGILIPAALIAGRYSLTIAAAILTAFALVLASGLTFGAQS